MPSPDTKLPHDSGTFDTSIKEWLKAMEKAKRIKPGGRLVFVNKKTGAAVTSPDGQ